MKKMGEAVTYEEILQNLTQRDFIDSSREDSPLTLTYDYRVLDNSKLSQAEQFEIAKKWVEEIVLIDGKA
jgi:cytidylate kinase